MGTLRRASLVTEGGDRGDERGASRGDVVRNQGGRGEDREGEGQHQRVKRGHLIEHRSHEATRAQGQHHTRSEAGLVGNRSLDSQRQGG